MTQAESGALIRVLRDQALITRAELAEMLLRDPDEIAAIETGAIPLHETDAHHLARVFDLEQQRAMTLVHASRHETRAAA